MKRVFWEKNSCAVEILGEQKQNPLFVTLILQSPACVPMGNFLQECFPVGKSQFDKTGVICKQQFWRAFLKKKSFGFQFQKVFLFLFFSLDAAAYCLYKNNEPQLSPRFCLFWHLYQLQVSFSLRVLFSRKSWKYFAFLCIQTGKIFESMGFTTEWKVGFRSSSGTRR